MQEQAIVIALVGILGIGAQWIAWRTNWPAIALMLAAGFLAGPVFHLFDPHHAFGELLEPMVAIGVALILFEGGLSLDLKELRHSGEAVARMVFLGVPIGWLFGALACYYVAGLGWPVAILFSGILVVTGPTVVMPLLRQSSVQTRPASILKWEAIVNDPIGALCAVVAYEYFRYSADGATVFEIVPPMIIAAFVSAGLGFAGAWVIAYAFPRGLIPEYLKVPVLLVGVVALFVGCNMIEHEAGLVAVTVMGIALANMNVTSLRSIHPFKQNIAVLLVSGIFILLSANIDFEQLRNFQWRFGLFLLVLLFAVRPATIIVCLLFSKVPWNERLFLAWIAPRGIVLVAISGLFALRLQELGFADGSILISLSFAVVVATILAHGFTIGAAARLFKVTGTTQPGLIIVGSNNWSVALAQQLHELKTLVMLVDSSWERLSIARRAGLPFYHGEILNEATEHNLDLTPYQVLVAATENEAYNALVCNEFAHEIGRDSVYQLGDANEEDKRALPESLRGRQLFGSGLGVEEVDARQSGGWVFRRTKLTEEYDFDDAKAAMHPDAQLLMILRESGRMRFFTHFSAPEPDEGDIIISFAPPASASEQAAKATEKAAKKAGRTAPKALPA